MRTPNFIVIGAPKCGTTSLYHYLNQHSEIFLARKEIHYFVRNDPKYKDVLIDKWPSYLKLFQAAEPGQILGEVAVRYLYNQQALVEIKERLPETKIIVMLRNPVERAFSHYLMRFRTGGYSSATGESLPTSEEISTAFEKYKTDYIAMSDFATALEPWYHAFSKDKIKIILMERLRDDPKGELQDLFGFLNVNSDVEIDTSKRFNVSTVRDYESKLIFLRRNKALRALRNSKSLRKFASSIVSRKALDRLQWREKGKTPHISTRVRLPDSTRQALEAHFSEGIPKLESMTGLNFACWHLNSS